MFQLLVGIGVSVLAIVLLLRQVSLEELGGVLSRAEPGPMAVVVVAVLGSLYARAARWQAYFLPDRRVPMAPAVSTLAISYMASTFLPFRAGELVRAVFLAGRERIPVAKVVGTILLEKLFDFLAIGVMLVILLATTPLPGVALVAGVSIVGVILGGFGFVVALAVLRGPTLRLLAVVEAWLPAGLGKRITLVRLAAHFAEGTDSLRRARLWVPMLAWSLAAWLFSVVQIWFGGQAVGLQLGMPAVLFTIVLTSTGQAVPSSPGYVGVFHAAAVLALTSFGVDAAAALGAAVLIHALSYGALVVSGIVALWLGGYALSDLAVGMRRPAVTLADESAAALVDA